MSKPLKRSSLEGVDDETPSKRAALWPEDREFAAPEDNNRMRVVVRVRPLNEREEMSGSKKTIDVIDNQLLVFDPIELNEDHITDDKYEYRGKMYHQIGRRPNKNMQFVFDRVFNENVDNIGIYEYSTKKFVEALLNGYNCAVFAYGATGSGKTHTMLGSADDPGVIFFTTMDLFRQIEAKAEEEKLELTISYFEIYNEMVYDLLGPTGNNLAVREDKRKGIVVQGLSVHQPTDATHLLEMLESGNRRRTQHPTDANSESSRSHAVFQISLKKQDFSSSQEMSIQVSKMSLIDLAGSERATTAYKNNRNKNLQREGCNINKSLLALGNCITALASTDPKRKSTYIPYRGSKLTLLLRDSLGGNCQTAMIATVSPSNFHYEETHNTLVYADRAKGIQLNFKKNNFNVGLQPRNYGQAIESQNRKIQELTNENQSLRLENERLREKMLTVPKNDISAKSSSIDRLNAAKPALDVLLEERLQFRRELMDCESNLKKIALRLLFKKFDIERQKQLATEDTDVASKSDPLQALYNQKLHYSGLKSSLEPKVEANETKIKKIKEELTEQCGENDWLITRFFLDEAMKAEFKDKECAEKHALEVAKEILSRMESNEELLTEAVRLNKKSFQRFHGMGLLSEEMKEAFHALDRKVDGKKNVIWKDDISSPILSKRKEVETLFSLPTYSAIPKTPLANTSRNLVSIHDITPYAIHLNGTPEKATPLSQRNLNLSRLSLTSTVNKVSKVGVVTPNRKHLDNEDDEENSLNDTFTIENNRNGRSPAVRRNWTHSPNVGYNSRPDRYYSPYNRNNAYKSRSPYQSNNHYNNQWNRSNGSNWRKPYYSSDNRSDNRPYGRSRDKSPNNCHSSNYSNSKPRFRF